MKFKKLAFMLSVLIGSNIVIPNYIVNAKEKNTSTIESEKSINYDENLEKNYEQALEDFDNIEFSEEDLANGIDQLLKNEIEKNHKNLTDANKDKNELVTTMALKNGFPPSSQTKYKLWVEYSKKVKQVKQDCDEKVCYNSN